MEHSIEEQFVILALNPEKGLISISSIPFKYSLTGALFMKYYNMGEFTIENNRIVPSFRKNGEIIHDMFSDRIMKSSRYRRISFWIRRLTNKSRLIFRQIIITLVNEKIIRIEVRKFLNIIPYNRYWLNDNSLRTSLIDRLREILLYGKKPVKNEIMLLGLVEASGAYALLSREKGEAKILRKKNSEFLKSDVIAAEISQTIREVHAAIIAAVTTATIAAHSSH